MRSRTQIPVAQWPGAGVLDQAYAVQRRTIEKLGLEPIGWKVGSTNPLSQMRRGITEPVYGRLLSRWAFQAGDKLTLNDFIDPCLEVEFAFRIGADLDARTRPLSARRITDAIESIVLAVEIADGRITNWRDCDGPSSVADNVAHGAFVLGQEIDRTFRDKLAAVETSLLVDSLPVASGAGAAVLGDPLRSIVWLANAVASHGEFLRAGDVVLSGTTTGVTQLLGGSTVTARFGVLGEFSFVVGL
ncbi:2-keto-4-pentenoate hydratase [Neoaquamicrobium sediminum]|uniref:2-keto-4-pentenoate hydratase n=1 Tax=Neoaquamicrobium sediminum TaxID=1849104 RepID=UPI0015637C8F|nr:fumarylacetoacetate hydrolase family protein [Mesorhizobium sediminum]NRC57332.1 hydratase [Mesorhizobium sediminum]